MVSQIDILLCRVLKNVPLPSAAQTVLTYFLRLNECTPREKELLKSTNEGDLMLQMLR